MGSGRDWDNQREIREIRELRLSISRTSLTSLLFPVLIQVSLVFLISLSSVLPDLLISP
jgi:hypothetical protein